MFFDEHRLPRTGPGLPRPGKWQTRFLELAKHISTWSKDLTKVGAVAWCPKSKDQLAIGYNGPPRGVQDLPERIHERPGKYLWMAHAEENVVTSAARKILEGSTVSVTHLCCARCCRMMINAGVSRIEYGAGKTSMPSEEFEVAQIMAQEAGVILIAVE